MSYPPFNVTTSFCLMFCVMRFSGEMLSSSCLAEDTQSHGLEKYIGKDLRELNEVAINDFRRQVDALTGDKPQREQPRYEPWWVKPFAVGSAKWLFLDAYPGYNIPDASSVRLHVFDKDWKRIASQRFPTGYRYFLDEAVVGNDNPLSQDLLVVKVTSSGPFIVQGNEQRPAFEQGDFQRQYYALLGDRFVLVRLEDNAKGLVRNHYRWRTPPKGPAVPKRTPQEWIHSFGSEDPVEQLETLVWLSGMHRPSTAPRHKNATEEGVEDAKLFEAVRDARATRSALERLQRSDNTWVREYAKFTAQLIAH